jgi:hypothetical protein
MKTPLDSALADAQGIIADLRRQLAERTAELDEAVAQLGSVWSRRGLHDPLHPSRVATRGGSAGGLTQR